MAEVNWIKGTIAPPESGDYYIILEAMRDIDPLPSGGEIIHKGDIEITTGWYDAKRRYFDGIGENNPFWRVLAWANVLKPDVPEDVKPRLRIYFGTKVKWEDGKWMIT